MSRSILIIAALVPLLMSSCSRSDSTVVRSPEGEASTPSTPTPEDILREVAEFYKGIRSFRVTIQPVEHEPNLAAEVEKSGMSVLTWPEDLEPSFALATTIDVVAQRPNLFAIRTKGGWPSTDYLCDGNRLVTFQSPHHIEREPPGSFDQFLDSPKDHPHPKLGSILLHRPTSDLILLELLAKDPHSRLLTDVVSSEYIGREELDGHAVHHLAFATEQRDWEIWVGANNTPLLHQIAVGTPKEFVRRYRGFVGAPKRLIVKRYIDWKLNEHYEKQVFKFTPPPSSRQSYAVPRDPPVLSNLVSQGSATFADSRRFTPG